MLEIAKIIKGKSTFGGDKWDVTVTDGEQEFNYSLVSSDGMEILPDRVAIPTEVILFYRGCIMSFATGDMDEALQLFREFLNSEEKRMNIYNVLDESLDKTHQCLNEFSRALSETASGDKYKHSWEKVLRNVAFLNELIERENRG